MFLFINKDWKGSLFSLSSAMLKKEQRLRKTKEIEFVFASGRSSYFGGLGIKVTKNNLAFARFTILVNKKVSKKAVVRNKLKRRLRELLKKHLDNLELVDLVVICQPEAATLELADLKKNLSILLNRLKVLRYVESDR